MISSTLRQLQSLFANPVFLSCIFSWFSAQFIKTVIKLLGGHVSSVKELLELLLWRTGGMPSSHSSLVCTLSTTIGFRAGINSDIFIYNLFLNSKILILLNISFTILSTFISSTSKDILEYISFSCI